MYCEPTSWISRLNKSWNGMRFDSKVRDRCRIHTYTPIPHPMYSAYLVTYSRWWREMEFAVLCVCGVAIGCSRRSMWWVGCELCYHGSWRWWRTLTLESDAWCSTRFLACIKKTAGCGVERSGGRGVVLFKRHIFGVMGSKGGWPRWAVSCVLGLSYDHRVPTVWVVFF